MKRALSFLVSLVCICVSLGAIAESDYVTLDLNEIGVTVHFLQDWTVVTRKTVAERYMLFDVPTSEIAANALYDEDIWAVAFSPEGGASLRVIAAEGDDTAALYYDIERYTPAMRTAIKDHFLNRDAWANTGYRYTEAEWTNKNGQGRILRLTYTLRDGDEVIAHGLQAYTVRNGLSVTLDLQVKGRTVTSAESRIFETFVQMASFPESVDMPLLPVGLTVTGGIPQETNKAELTLRGQTLGGAAVRAWFQGEGGDPEGAAEAVAASSGTFRLDITIPQTGEYRLFVVASMDGYAESVEAGWISYDPNRIPVNFITYPSGIVNDAQVIVSGTTISGVAVTYVEDETSKKVVTGSDGAFSIKADRAVVGDRTALLTFTKDGYEGRSYSLSFNRQWQMADYIQYLSGQLQALSYANLTEKADKYVGRLVKYSGLVLDVSGVGERVYVQLALTKNKDGSWTDRLIAVADGMDVHLEAGDSASLYVEISGESYTFPTMDEDGIQTYAELPAVSLLAYEIN